MRINKYIFFLIRLIILTSFFIWWYKEQTIEPLVGLVAASGELLISCFLDSKGLSWKKIILNSNKATYRAKNQTINNYFLTDNLFSEKNKIIKRDKSNNMSNQNINIIDSPLAVGINTQNLNIERPSRKLNINVQKELDKQLGTSKKDVRITSVMNDQEALVFAQEIKSYLIDNGYSVTGVDQAAYNNPVIGQIIDKKEDRIEIIIGSRE